VNSCSELPLHERPPFNADANREIKILNSIPHLWQELRRGERKALREFSRFADFQPLAKIERVSRSSMEALIQHGLALEGEASMYGPSFKLTPEGRRAATWLNSAYRVRSTLSPTPR
jgi:hypothetical protein